MMLKTQKRIAAGIFDCSPKKVHFNEEKLAEIKEAITKQDIKTLITDGVITRIRSNEQSKVRTRQRALQRSKGRQRGAGTRKGSPTSRLSRKARWVSKIRLQRKVIQDLRLKNEITHVTYRDLYMKSKGGFFRNKRHLELYITEHKLRVTK